MLKKRLIPVLILREGNVVQSLKFKHTNIIHSKVSIAVDHFNRWSADEIIVIDVSPDLRKREAFYNSVRELSRTCFVPLTVGGWITSRVEIRKLLRCGADKVTINTHAVQNPDFIEECARENGSQCIVAAIDVKINPAGDYRVYIDRGKSETKLQPEQWAREVQQFGAGEIYLTAIDRDGARNGYDFELISRVVDAVDIPVIAFGGVANWQDMVDGIKIGKADAVAAANIFHYSDYSASKAKDFLRQADVDVR